MSVALTMKLNFEQEPFLILIVIGKDSSIDRVKIKT